MRRIGKWRWLGIAALLVAGCKTTAPEVKPKDQPEDYMVPPESDTRYSTHINYPSETLFNDVIRKEPTGPNDVPKPTKGFGAGPGMGMSPGVY
jgi:hypothetical protein